MNTTTHEDLMINENATMLLTQLQNEFVDRNCNSSIQLVQTETTS